MLGVLGGPTVYISGNVKGSLQSILGVMFRGVSTVCIGGTV